MSEQNINSASAVNGATAPAEGMIDISPTAEDKPKSEQRAEQSSIQPAPNKESMLPTILAMLALMVSIACAFYLYRYDPSGGKQDLYVVDMGAIVEMRLMELVTESPEAMRTKSTEFTNTLDAEVSRLTKNGAVLLAPDAVIAGRDAIDITDPIAKSVGVTMTYDVYRKQKAAARQHYNEQITSQLRNQSSVPAAAPATTSAEGANATKAAPNLD